MENREDNNNSSGEQNVNTIHIPTISTYLGYKSNLFLLMTKCHLMLM